MSLASGDPLFKRPSRNTSSFYAPLPEPSDLEAVEDPTTGRPIPPPNLAESSTRDSFRNPDGSNSSPSAASKTMSKHSGDGQSSTDHFSMPTPQLLAKNVHPENKPFVLGHSRNSSDQSVRSKASAGYGSGTHSRQGSSDDGNNVTVRLVFFITEFLFATHVFIVHFIIAELPQPAAVTEEEGNIIAQKGRKVK